MRKHVRWISIGLLTFAILAGFAYWFTQQHIVLRLPGGFLPNVVHIEKNESITFINMTLEPSWPAAGPHPTHISYPDFDPQEGIKPGRSWTFTFTQEGAFTFHDHFAPEMNGTVISGTNDISQITDPSVCEAITDDLQQASCIEIYFRNITERAGYLQARTIYEDIAVRYPNSCHNFAHDLGKSAYMAYLENTLPEIGQEASSCAYGLWHGFTTAMQSDRGFEASKEFCSSFTGKTDELQRVNRMNCYHGIGIGLIPDPPSPHLWGDFQSVIDPGLSFCDTVQGDPLFKERCLTGIFHAMTTFMVNKLYDFALDEDSLAYCAQQKPEHQYTCFITLVSAIPKLTNNDLERTIAILQKHSPSHEMFLEMFINAAIMSVDIEDTVEEMGHFIEKCGAHNVDLRSTCIGAVINNLHANGAPGIEYLKAIEFCSGAWIHDSEQVSCFSEVIGYSYRMYTPEKMVEVCNLIPNEYRADILECRIL